MSSKRTRQRRSVTSVVVQGGFTAAKFVAVAWLCSIAAGQFGGLVHTVLVVLQWMNAVSAAAIVAILVLFVLALSGIKVHASLVGARAPRR